MHEDGVLCTLLNKVCQIQLIGLAVLTVAFHWLNLTH